MSSGYPRAITAVKQDQSLLFPDSFIDLFYVHCATTKVALAKSRVTLGNFIQSLNELDIWSFGDYDYLSSVMISGKKKKKKKKRKKRKKKAKNNDSHNPAQPQTDRRGCICF